MNIADELSERIATLQAELRAAQERAETAERERDDQRKILNDLWTGSPAAERDRLIETLGRVRESHAFQMSKKHAAESRAEIAEATVAQQAATIKRMRELIERSADECEIPKCLHCWWLGFEMGKADGEALATDLPATLVSDGLEHAIARIPGEPSIHWETSKDGWHKQDTMPETPCCEQCGVEVRAILCEDCSEWSLRQQAIDPPVSEAPDSRDTPCLWCAEMVTPGEMHSCKSLGAYLLAREVASQAPPTPDAAEPL